MGLIECMSDETKNTRTDFVWDTYHKKSPGKINYDGNCQYYKHKRPSEHPISFRDEIAEFKEKLDAIFAKTMIEYVEKPCVVATDRSKMRMNAIRDAIDRNKMRIHAIADAYMEQSQIQSMIAQQQVNAMQRAPYQAQTFGIGSMISGALGGVASRQNMSLGSMFN
jgi:hypothetical protein